MKANGILSAEPTNLNTSYSHFRCSLFSETLKDGAAFYGRPFSNSPAVIFGEIYVVSICHANGFTILFSSFMVGT